MSCLFHCVATAEEVGWLVGILVVVCRLVGSLSACHLFCYLGWYVGCLLVFFGSG